jgi:thioredoxin reductase
VRPRDDLAEQLGCAQTGTPIAAGVIVTDAERCTSIPGVYAAGDAAAVIHQVAGAIAGGSEAAARLHRSLVLEQT